MSATPASRTVQTYNLFGESGDLPDVVHCETIAARSVLHEWEFAPHRHPRLHQILLIERGGGQATLEGRIHALRPMRVVNVPVGDVHGFSFKPGTQGWVLTVSAEMLDEVLTPSEGLAAGAGAFDRGARHAGDAQRDAADLRRVRRAPFRQGASAAGLVRGPDRPGRARNGRQRQDAGRHGEARPVPAVRDAARATLPAALDRVGLCGGAVDHADASEPPDPRGDRSRGIASDPRPRDPRGAAQPRLYQPAGLDDRLRARLQRPGLFQPAVFRSDRPVAASFRDKVHAGS